MENENVNSEEALANDPLMNQVAQEPEKVRDDANIVNIHGGREIPEPIVYGTFGGGIAAIVGDPAEEADEIERVRQFFVKENKTLRVGLDNLLQILQTSSRKSRERSLSITKLQESIMWLGMDNKALHEANPYPNSYKPENAIVDPTADGLKL